MEGGQMIKDDTLNSKLIVFTGAGASAGLNLPTTPEFAKRLEEKATNESSLLAVYRTNVSQTNRISEKEVPIDSEYIRDWLEDMKLMAKSIEDLSPVMRRIINPKAPTANNVVLSVDSLLNAFDSQIIGTYGIPLEPELAFRHYWPLLCRFSG